MAKTEVSLENEELLYDLSSIIYIHETDNDLYESRIKGLEKYRHDQYAALKSFKG